MKLKLLDNSHVFVNESIANARRAKRDHQYWTFAILHLIQGLELLLKHVLELEHSILIYENIDTPKNTVTLNQALDRLRTIASIEISDDEKKIIRRASVQRNKIVHHEYELNANHLKSVYTQLFEFVYYFHLKHLKTELHDYIDQKLWGAEAELLSSFKQGWVNYRGRTIQNHHPLEIVVSQRYNGLRTGVKGKYKYYKRHRYGSGPDKDFVKPDVPCQDCAVEFGELHIPYCDLESCPICCEQLLSCACNKDFRLVNDEEMFEPRQIELEIRVRAEHEAEVRRFYEENPNLKKM